jgi:hypothetical protein
MRSETVPKGEESRLTATEVEFAQMIWLRAGTGGDEKLSLENFETEGFEDEYQNMVRATLLGSRHPKRLPRRVWLQCR